MFPKMVYNENKHNSGLQKMQQFIPAAKKLKPFQDRG